VSDGGLSYHDTAQILRRLGSVTEDVVLIGGQAVHFWVNAYAARDPFLSQGAPFTSKDVDFCGSAKAAAAAAVALGGTLRTPTLDEATPNTGLVTFKHSGEEYEIDFLDKPHGVAVADVTRMSPTVDAGVGDVRFKVLSPVLCMESRFCNTSLPGYDSEHAWRQLQASIVCARESLRDISTVAPRAFLRLAERVFWFARISPQARDVYERRRIDPLEAIPRDLVLPAFEKFYSLRLPQMRTIVARERERRERDQARRRVQAEKKRQRQDG
jgi:hypothetical protein